ncbi:MAG: hypothetical protein J6J42_07695 [Lachnospiraceae bacterium]|nr:hypothetical protein [Lachnospiraceae bacterium]MBP3610201.1 hypothetical protein [Lachnospiraceae bacterium]
MSQNRIEQLIEELYEYIEDCKPKGFSTTQVVVSKEEIYDILDEMKLRIPDEIRQCAKVIQNKNQILAAAEERAEKIIEDAKRQAEMLVQDDEIVRQAFLKAQEMVSRSSAQADQLYRESNEAAEQITMSALDYTNKMLAAVESVVAQTYEETKARTEAMLQTLEGNLRIIQENRRELTEDVAPQEEEAAMREPAAPARNSYSEEEEELYNLDAEAFLDNIE